MLIDEIQVLDALTRLARSGHDVAALDLHLDALLAARSGDLDRANESFAAARIGRQWSWSTTAPGLP